MSTSLGSTTYCNPRGTDEARRISIRIQVLDDFRARRGEISGDVWSIIETMNDSFPLEPQDMLLDDSYLRALTDTFNTVQSCFKVFTSRYTHNARGTLPIMQLIFKEVLKLVTDALENVKELIQHRLSAPCGRHRCRCVASSFKGKSDVYNNLITLMTQVATFKNEDNINYWINTINFALDSAKVKQN